MINKLKEWLRSIGPAFIIAAVVLGPGSITTSTKIGSTQGSVFFWAIALAAFFMAAYTNMSARFGMLHKKSILGVMAEKYGRWFSSAIGLSSFFAALSFQFGNNLGVGMGMETLTGINAKIWPPIFTLFAITLIFFTKYLYKTLEKLMMFIVMLMIIAFTVNLIFIKPDLTTSIKGFVPKPFFDESFNHFVAIVGTTFVLHCALYQSYLVQNKGWKIGDLTKGIRDSNLGVLLLALISILIIITAASTLWPLKINVNSAADMAFQLEILFGSYSKYIFALGFVSAAFSSLLVNAVIGGGLLSDGLGLGKSMDERIPKVFTALILLSGMAISIYGSNGMGNPVYSLILAQASSMLAVPLIAIGLLLLLNNQNVMGKYKNTLFQNIVALAGFILVFVLVYVMYKKLIDYIGTM